MSYKDNFNINGNSFAGTGYFTGILNENEGLSQHWHSIDWEDPLLYTMPLMRDELAALNNGLALPQCPTPVIADVSPEAHQLTPSSCALSRALSPADGESPPELHCDTNSSTWAARNPTRPMLHRWTPLPRLSDAQKASQKIKKDQRTAVTKHLHDAVAKHLQEQKNAVILLSLTHNITPKHIDNMISNQTKYHTARKVNLTNALIHAKAKEMDNDQPNGSRHILPKLHEMVAKDPDMQDLTRDEKAAYVAALSEHHEKKGVKFISPSSIGTVSKIHKLCDMLRAKPCKKCSDAGIPRKCKGAPTTGQGNKENRRPSKKVKKNTSTQHQEATKSTEFVMLSEDEDEDKDNAKYALATTSKILDVYSSNGATGYNIGCSYSKTVAASSISTKASAKHHRFLVNTFHGHTHNHQCQIQYHLLYQEGLGIEDLETCKRIFSASNAVAPVICHASYFHWLQFNKLHFDQWDLDKYSELSKFIYNNYKQALHIVNELSPAVQELKTLATETKEDIEKMTYVKALESLASAEAKYRSVTSVQFLSYSLTDFMPTQGLRKSVQTVARAREAEHSAAYCSCFIRVVEHLEGLVVKRLFELAKANLAGTSYKLRQHISNAITQRSAAIHAALDKYNDLAPLQNPPQLTLTYHEQDLLSKPWASKTNCEVAAKYFKVVRAHEELARLNVEVVWLHAWVNDEDTHLSSVARSLSETDPALAYKIQCWFEECHQVNNIHCTKLEAIYDLPGYNGLIQASKKRREGKDGDHVEWVLGDLEGSSTILVDEDDVLCDKDNHLDACMSE
ncbi:uncharacterized protein F5147DRAFT_780519 [Suillus discolor]|uniref:Uncharacterized protein n=1 Tax=Suillus discolor TaxID=1912936 RepID=A0A9P7ETB7_9AGAM|nr:uncharacterized protein F5147DRAFT_780519 [Suillus discolor]KAG2089874.1 hypothetical protein F5147DRAFT_780519 [Suillus discolor]